MMMMMMKGYNNNNNCYLTTLLVVIFLTLTATTTTAAAKSSSGRRHLEVQNDSGAGIALDWLNPATGETVPLTEETSAGERIAFESYVNHTFVVRATTTTGSSSSSNDKMNATFVTVASDKGDQVFVVKQGLQVELRELHPTTTTQTRTENVTAISEACRDMALQQLANGDKVETVQSSFLECAQDAVAAVLQEKSATLSFENDLLKSISALAENYTCADPDKETTKPREMRTWEYNGVVRNVGILHDRPASQIHILEDFISEQECEAVKQAAAPTLHRGTVADGNGGSRMSDHRKAWQAGVKVDYSKGDNDPLVALKKRIFAYAEHAVGYGMTLPGQEDIMSIQYFGSGQDDPTPDRYTPHCDGECNGRPSKKGARVATIVAYCDVPTLGGATNFQNANVIVQPKKYAAAFFSYMDPVTRKHEEGFTSHSGCPVLLGEKRIAVQWMRIGVDDDAPWDSFDTNTISKDFYRED